jgi:hypothetical protein
MLWFEPIKRILVGLVSGVAASLVKYWTHDHTNVLAMISKKDWDQVVSFALGYGVGLAVLMLLGGIAAWISKETDIRKLFFIGLSAPALFAAGINTPSGTPNQATPPPAELRIEPKKGTWWIDQFSLVSPAHADDDEACIGDSSFTKGLKTFFGMPQQKYDRYRVIVWSTKDPKAAATKAKAVNAADPTLKASVGKRACDSEYYPVLVGDYLPLEEAKKLRDRASQLDAVDDPYLSPGPR